MHSAVLIVPLAQHALADQLGEAMGWGPNNYSVPLSTSGSEPATHFGLHAWVTQDFVEMMAAVGSGNVPPVPGMTPAEVVEVTSALIVSIQTDSTGHWAGVLAENGLQVVA